MPDGPLLFGLALAAWALSRLFFDPGEDERRVWRLWLLAGLGFGLAGLSKYIGALAPLGLLAFLVISPSERRWFRHPAPYVAAMLAGLIVLPVFVWNAQHGWASFAFQGAARRRVGGFEAVAGPASRAWADRLPVPLAVCPASGRPPLGLAQVARRPAAFSFMPLPSADCSFHGRPAMDRKRPAALVHGRLVLRFSADGRLGAGYRGPRPQSPPLRHSIRHPSRGADRKRSGRGANRLAMAPFAGWDDRPDAGSPRLERTCQSPASATLAAFRHLHPLAGRRQDRAGAWAERPDLRRFGRSGGVGRS